MQAGNGQPCVVRKLCPDDGCQRAAQQCAEGAFAASACAETVRVAGVGRTCPSRVERVGIRTRLIKIPARRQRARCSRVSQRVEILCVSRAVRAKANASSACGRRMRDGDDENELLEKYE